MSCSDSPQPKAEPTSIENCELALDDFCAAADADEGYMLAVAEAVWKLLSADPGSSDPAELVAQIRMRVATMDGAAIARLSRILLDAATTRNNVHRAAAKLVAGWFTAIALDRDASLPKGRTLHVVRSYERTFAALGRLSAGQRKPSGNGP